MSFLQKQESKEKRKYIPVFTIMINDRNNHYRIKNEQ